MKSPNVQTKNLELEAGGGVPLLIKDRHIRKDKGEKEL